MSIRSKSEVIASIKTRNREIHGEHYTIYDAFCGKNDITKKKIRLFAATRQGLMEKIDSFYKERENSGELASMLTPDQLMDAKLAFYSLKEAKVNVSLVECVRREIERMRIVSAHDIAIGIAWNEYFASKREGDDKNKAGRTAGRWVSCVGEDALLSTITTKSITEYLKTEYDAMAPKTYNSHLGYINTFLNWCCKEERRYLTENPAKSIPRKEEAWKEPEYMHPDTVEKIFRILENAKGEHPDFLALAINGFFCGIRREESHRMAELVDAAKIHLEDETVRIGKGKGYTNGRRPRAFTIEPNALAWMKSFDFEKAVSMIHPATTQNMTRYLEKHGIKWFHNAPRHTFITMHVAAYGDPAKTQAMCGTSGNMLCNNYRGLASKREGEAHFAIYPTGTASCSQSCAAAS